MNFSIDTVKTRYGIVGHNPRLISAIEVAIQVAPTDVTVLIHGENGTGKDVFSRIIHQFSKRKHQNFMAINCGAIPEGTMDSELFGHEKGAFTSAYETRKGYFEEVDTGTIFLDEIGEMPLATQSRLLRLLENQEYLRVGSSKIRRADVRVVAATNKNLIELIRQGKFREDLYYRLNTVSISVPPLRERGSDVELLFRYFADEFSDKYQRGPLTPTPEAAEMISQYRWPGNVRELRNFVEKLSVLVRDDTVTAEIIHQHLNISERYLPSLSGVSSSADEGQRGEQAREIQMLYKLLFNLREEVAEMKKALYMGMNAPQGIRQEEEPDIIIESGEDGGHYSIVREKGYTIDRPVTQSIPAAQLPEGPLNLEQKEKELITRALQKHNNNRKKAAQELGISERTLYRKIKHFDI